MRLAYAVGVARIQVTNESSVLTEASLCVSEILLSNWHLGIDQIQQMDTQGLITWISLIYANSLKC